jgi:hypothetical protein
MERMTAGRAPLEAERKRRDNISIFVGRIVERRDSEMSHHALILNYEELSDSQRNDLIQVICDDHSGIGEEMAFQTLHDQPLLDDRYRRSLLEHIVASGDKTTSSLTLQFVPELGEWEARLRDVLAS